MTMRRLIPAGVLMSVLCGSALAVPATPPNPVPRPDVGIVIAPEATSTALRPVAEALDRNDGASALAAARALPSGTVRETALWLVARSSVDGIDAQARFSLLDALAGWPDLALIQRRAEATLFEEDPDARGIARAMGSRQPAGFEGRILAARRHLSANERTAAANIIRPLWRTARLSSGAEALVIRDFAPLLTAQDHIERANRMIYDGRRASAETAMERLSATSRARLDARLIASRNTERGIAAIEALGAGALSDPHLRFSYVQVLRRSGAFSRAARILADAPSNPETLLDPDAWWVERRALARELLEEDKPREAYAVVTRRAQAGAIPRLPCRNGRTARAARFRYMW